LLYMCVGGVPFYLKNLEPGWSVAQILEQLFFVPQARLAHEFENLYAALFKNYKLHEQLVTVLSTKNMGMTRTDLSDLSQLATGGGLTVVLQELIVCGFVQEIFPHGKSRMDKLYRLVDEFTLFYLKFKLHERKIGAWTDVTTAGQWNAWKGYAFEGLCFRHVPQIKRALGISGVNTTESSWVLKGTAQLKGAQIDMLLDRKDNCINLIEAKFQDAPWSMTKEEASALTYKREAFISQSNTSKNIFITLISASGAERNPHYLSVITNEVLLEALFG
jgi:uncharacterized protein